MNKENCTKGPYLMHEVGGENSVNDHCSAFMGSGDCTVIAHIEAHDFNDDTTTTDEQKANAELIAEAFNVLHHRGYTPLELVEHKGILIAALKDLMESFACKCSDEENPDWTPSYDRAAKLIQAIEQGKDLPSHQPVTPA